MKDPWRIAIVGYGKIARDQHHPSIVDNPAFELAAIVSRRDDGPAHIPWFPSIEALRNSGLPIDAGALYNPPLSRPATAIAAIDAGWHVLLEKPPAATLGAVADMQARADRARVTLFATWHSRCNPAVTLAASMLRQTRITGLSIEWREDVHKWHPGQEWIWQPGGFGVFDPGINALSIATAILPFDLIVSAADLALLPGSDTPIAVTIDFDDTATLRNARAVFDWRRTERECWTLRVDTEDGPLILSDGGARLEVRGQPVSVAADSEYRTVYARFAELIGSGTSDVDVRPLRLVADAFLIGRRRILDDASAPDGLRAK
jgi:predicted dehydrogenase